MTVRILTPAQYIKLHRDERTQMSRKKDARHYVGDGSGFEIGPFIEEADARLCRAACAYLRPDKEWGVSEHEAGS